MKLRRLAIILGIVCSLWGCTDGQKEKVTVNEIRNPASAESKNFQKELSNMPVITFEKLTHEFGKVLQGERLSYTFKFTNTGKSNLVIEGTETSCGCTTTTPPKAPIRPGDSGEIKVTFDSKTKMGSVSNVVVVSANTYPVQTVLRVNAEVIVP